MWTKNREGYHRPQSLGAVHELQVNGEQGVFTWSLPMQLGGFPGEEGGGGEDAGGKHTPFHSLLHHLNIQKGSS